MALAVLGSSGVQSLVKATPFLSSDLLLVQDKEWVSVCGPGEKTK